MKIALIGADGQLGSDLLRLLRDSHEVIPLFYPEYDITRPVEARRRLSELGADAVINTAAYNRVDAAEEETRAAFALNALAVRDLALICKEQNSILVHYSSDYVFSGKKSGPYTEEDPPGPLSVYGVSKLAGEYFVASICKRFFLIRTCGLYGVAGCWGKGTNFVDAVIAKANRGDPLRIVNDQKVTPTATHELAAATADLIENADFGLYHLTNQGECTWYEFAREILEGLRLDPEITAIDSRELKAPAVRPAYSVLENRRADSAGLRPMAHWKIALKEYLIRKGFLSEKNEFRG
jgi:dTDP-4-dehydrorhamnose reductase